MKIYLPKRSLCVTTLALACALGAASGCAESETKVADPVVMEDWDYYADSPLYLKERSHANVVRKLIFLSEESPGVVRGFDLDERTSSPSDRETCRHADLEDPAGREGIDNQVATLFALLEPIVEDTPQIAIQGAINEGRVLVMIEVDGVDDLQNDDDVTVNVFRASGRPLVGNKGLIMPFQTFHVDYDLDVSTVTGAKIVNGELEAGPVDIEIPMDVLDASFPMRLSNGRVRVKIAEDGSFTGLIGGAINVADVFEEFGIVVDGPEDDLMRPIFEANADMGYVDGVCTEISMAFGIEGDIAYPVHDATQE
jgi:hypothetical protein